MHGVTVDLVVVGGVPPLIEDRVCSEEQVRCDPLFNTTLEADTNTSAPLDPLQAAFDAYLLGQDVEAGLTENGCYVQHGSEDKVRAPACSIDLR